MGCLTLKVTPVEGAALNAAPVQGASLKVTPADAASLKVAPAAGVSLAATPVGMASLKAVAVQGAILSVGTVCSVTPGTIVVLAASDGPLRTRDGGYLLLDPATNPPEN